MKNETLNKKAVEQDSRASEALRSLRFGKIRIRAGQIISRFVALSDLREEERSATQNEQLEQATKEVQGLFGQRSNEVVDEFVKMRDLQDAQDKQGI